MNRKDKPPRRMQMADLARLAGVSSSTVSRALAGSPLVNEATRARIQALARQFDYTVNSVATHLRSGVPRTIAVVVPYEQATRQSFADPFLHGMVGSLADALTERGYEMLLARVDAERLEGAATLVAGGRAGGLILIGQWHQHATLNALAQRGIPLVVWGARMPGQRYSTVGGDNLLGGRLVGEHLLALGRRRMIFLGDTSLPEVALRHRGFCAALRAGGANAPARASVPFLAERGRAAMLALLDRHPDVDAVFASSDLLAMAAIGALRERHREVPGEVAVVGYDDVELAAHFSPPLTTVRQPIQSGGEALVERLLAILAGDSAPRAQLLETRLIERASTRSS